MVGAAALPYQISDLSWGWGTSESVPPKEQWNISWRDDAKHVIILFSDEEGQSYMNPTITEPILTNMVNAADELAVYVFTSSNVINWGGAYDYKSLTDKEVIIDSFDDSPSYKHKYATLVPLVECSDEDFNKMFKEKRIIESCFTKRTLPPTSRQRNCFYDIR